jgi:hypothetical protein
MEVTVMKTVQIRGQVLSGNMGDGWRDEFETAKGFASYVEGKLREDARAYFGEDAEIKIDIDVQRASGCSRDLTVDFDDEDYSNVSVSQVEGSLSYAVQKAWEEWCGGEGESYFSED